MKALASVSVCIALWLVGCSSPAPVGASDRRETPALRSPDGNAPAALAPTVRPTTMPTVEATDAEVRAVARSHNDFGFDLWRKLSEQHPGNLAISPTSVAVALGMTLGGARESTEAEMRRVLHLNGARVIGDVPHRLSGALITRWNAKGTPYQLRVANRLFGERTMHFEAPFLGLMISAYGASLEPIDFVRAADASRAGINRWVEEQTESRIKELMPSGAVDAFTRLVLVNAIYFKGQWASRFDEARTQPGEFHTPTGVVTVPMMQQDFSFAFGESDDATVLQMPYVGGDLAMMLVLPRGDLGAIEEKLSDTALATWLRALRPPRNYSVGLPRFRIESDSISLKQPLSALGMPSAFTPAANFVGLSSAERLFIDDVFHKTFLEVNEEGAEAAAATAVGVRAMSAGPSFIADRPFLFLLRDLRSGHVLFLGRVVDPTEA